MKKIILSLFLVLATLSFSAPSRVDVKKIESKGYTISQNDSEILVYGESSPEKILSVGYYVFKDQDSKETVYSLSQSSIENLSQTFKLVDSIENKRAFINRFSAENGNYAYSIVGKNTKIKDYYILILYGTNTEISKNDLDKVANKLLDEAESYLK